MLLNMKDLLDVANEHNFAIGAFNTSSNMILRGVMEASIEMNAPVIISIHPDELSFVRPSFVASVIKEANNTPIPVCIHLDHGSNYQQVLEAIQCGFTSVMIDGSHLDFEDNIELCKQVVDIAHPVNVSVEGELGTIGNIDSSETGDQEILFTDPDKASEFMERTGIDCLAVAIGTSHGLYPKDMKPELRIDILKKIKQATNAPLVLHGGSSNHDSEIAKSIEHGINKINISSDIKQPFYQEVRRVLDNAALREPNEIYPSSIEVLKDVVREKIKLFGTEGKAYLYFK